MRHVKWILTLWALSVGPPAGATSTPGVLLTRKTVGDQYHKIAVAVADRGDERVFTVTLAAKDGKVPLEVAQGYLSVYDGERLIVGCWVRASDEKGVVSYEFAVAATHLKKSGFSFLAATATSAERKNLPSGGGWTNYTIPLAEFAAPAAPVPAGVMPPEVRFAGPEVRGSSTVLLFDVVNPNPNPIPYLGYRPDSFTPHLPDGTISPLYKIEYRKGAEWKEYGIGWCGWGRGPVSVGNKQKARFDAPIYQEDWDEVRVGVVWYSGGDGKNPQTAWSKPLARKDVLKGDRPTR